VAWRSRAAGINYRGRMPTYLAGFALVASVVWPEARGPWFWTTLATWVLLWPHLAYLITARSRVPATLVERRLVLVDAVFIGVFIAVTSFRPLPSVALALPPLLSAGRVGGLASAALSLLALGLGMGAAIAVDGPPRFHTDVTPLTMALSIGLALAFTIYIGVVSKAQGDVLRHRSKALADALAQQTATSETLRAIIGSHTDIQPLFQSIIRSAVALCDGSTGAVFRFDGQLVHLVAHHNYPPEAQAAMREAFPRPASADFLAGRAIIERQVVNVADLQGDQTYALNTITRMIGVRGFLAVPMLRDGEPIGVIAVQRATAGRFSVAQIDVLKTFADQAVVAIGGAWLFEELGRALEETRALNEVTQAISISLDVREVLDTVVRHAVRLTGADAALFLDYDTRRGVFVPAAAYALPPALLERIEAVAVDPYTGALGRALHSREHFAIKDVTITKNFVYRELMLDFGYRVLSAVGIPSDGALRVLTLLGRDVGHFDERVVRLLQALSRQSKVAMDNARLFQELQAVSQHKSTFLANMSHELRTPLNAIIGLSELLIEDAQDRGDDSRTDDLDKIRRAGLQLLGLINEILDLSKIEAGRMELFPEWFDVAAVVADVAETTRVLAEKRSNTLEVDCAPDLGTMHADQTRVRQGLLNISTNAAKFTEHGTITIAAARRSDDGRPWIVFQIADTGIGMTHDQTARLFQDFTQADASTARRYGGTGLGLAISRRFCRMMGGDIGVESKPALGSTFTIRLPVETEIVSGRSS
jgi:signal transduction histidine kinase